MNMFQKVRAEVLIQLESVLYQLTSLLKKFIMITQKLKKLFNILNF